MCPLTPLAVQFSLAVLHLGLSRWTNRNWWSGWWADLWPNYAKHVGAPPSPAADCRDRHRLSNHCVAAKIYQESHSKISVATAAIGPSFMIARSSMPSPTPPASHSRATSRSPWRRSSGRMSAGGRFARERRQGEPLAAASGGCLLRLQILSVAFRGLRLVVRSGRSPRSPHYY